MFVQGDIPDTVKINKFLQIRQPSATSKSYTVSCCEMLRLELQGSVDSFNYYSNKESEN